MPKVAKTVTKRTAIIFEQKSNLKKKSQENQDMTHEGLKNWFNNEYNLVIERSTVSKILKTFVVPTEVNKDLTKIKRNRNAKYPQLKSALY
jgi:aconitase B